MHRPPGHQRHNLPASLSTFVGREGEVADLLRLLASHRLLTLVGSGGVGKTRLALRVAEDVLGTYSDGVSFIDLAPLVEAALIPQLLLVALGSPLLHDGHPRDAVIDFLQSREALVVLDNCEHLVDGCAELVDILLRTCPRLRVLATSREPLGVEGEATWRVPSLLSPDRNKRLSAAQAATYEAVQLFVERARLVLPGFDLTDDNAAHVAEVCHRLDGIPLALELAAARLRVIPVERLAERLNDHLRLLVGGSRTASPRHQTVRATLDWSHGLLAGAERTLFRRLTVFAGGFTLEAVEAVCAGGGVSPNQTLDLLTGLVDRSLVLSGDIRGGEPRYRLLETMRQYALERLDELAETTSVRMRHRDWYLALAERALPELTGPDQRAWYRRLTADYDNLRLALDWSRADPDGAEAQLRLVAALGRYWNIHRPVGEGRDWLKDALARGPSAPSAARATVLNWAGVSVLYDGNSVAGRALLEESVAVARQVNDSRLLTVALRHLGVALHQQDDGAARAVLEEALAVARAADDAREVTYSLTFLGRLLEDAGDPVVAERMYTEALAAGRSSEDALPLSNVLLNLGRIAAARGEHARAVVLMEESLDLSRELRYTGSGERGTALLHLANLARTQHDLATARARCMENLELARNANDRLMMAASLVLMGGLEQAAGRFERAAFLFGAEAAGRARQGSLDLVRYPPPTDPARYADDLAAIRRALGDDGFAVAWGQGQAMTVEEASRIVLADDMPAEVNRPTREPAAGLTAREQEVATLVARGLSNRQIAEELVFGERTAEAHVGHCLAKLGLTSRTQLATWAATHGLLQTTEPTVRT
jgi:predicted ATPase/DNA-binding CsgD family transcriptional regulator